MSLHYLHLARQRTPRKRSCPFCKKKILGTLSHRCTAENIDFTKLPKWVIGVSEECDEAVITATRASQQSRVSVAPNSAAD
jgi:hypothetical protein